MNFRGAEAPVGRGEEAAARVVENRSPPPKLPSAEKEVRP